MVSNDVDIMRKVETEFTTASVVYKHLEQRIAQIMDRIVAIPIEEEEYSSFSLCILGINGCLVLPYDV